MSDSTEKIVSKQFLVAAFYAFNPLTKREIDTLLPVLTEIAYRHDIRGTVLFATEGINGTVCGSNSGVSELLKVIDSSKGKNPLQVKFSFSSQQAFRRFKAKHKHEIVTMGVSGVDPCNSVGKYVEPKDWNYFLDDPDTLVIDTRNEYEVGVGTFEGSINPHTETFRQFPDWVESSLKPLLKGPHPKKIAMFCTGGIRCEKATSYLNKEGFSEVHHLHGGILRYLEEIPEDQSRWKGECFVFDQRVALNHQLLPGSHKLCFACGMPLSPIDCEHVSYVPGIQCHYCIDSFTDEDRARFSERQKHINELSKRLPGNSIWPSS